MKVKLKVDRVMGVPYTGQTCVSGWYEDSEVDAQCARLACGQVRRVYLAGIKAHMLRTSSVTGVMWPSVIRRPTAEFTGSMPPIGL